MLISSSCMGKNKNTISDPEIPFLIYDYEIKTQQGTLQHLEMGKAKNSMGMTAEISGTKLIKIKSSKIKKLIKDLKDSLCNVIEFGEFKIWLKVDLSTNAVVLSVSAETGIEVLIRCKSPPK